MSKPKKKRIPVDVTLKEHRAFKYLADSQFMTLTGLIRKLLNRELESQNKIQAA
jgi:hypothetical protein